ncbi:hypothetical protein SpAn4DRAFT_3634 [Sporomusa ovata]|uniref:Uncharacterized protein n=1 Tax=Sporomusa ovata TaxID=2378 RepID=A0A0U1KWF3_9FIRM|nr:hypothetical protein SpAn4DRAFT_3634 [Sporomusa ovata]
MAHFTAKRIFGMSEAKAKALAFEVGMQNSGLGAALVGARPGKRINRAEYRQ